jgi:hypothetical protein
VILVSLGNRDSRVSLVQLVFLEHPANQDSVATQDHQDSKVLLETLELQDSPDSRDNSVRREQLDNRASKVLLEQLAQMAR